MVGVDAVARVAARLDGIVNFPVTIEGFELVWVHGGFGDGGGVRAGQRFVGHGREGAADFDGRGKACADEDVGCVYVFRPLHTCGRAGDEDACRFRPGWGCAVLGFFVSRLAPFRLTGRAEGRGRS